ncbi:LIM domain-containing protein 2 [Paraphysoderma sedebokerense]|nr:LIM domain-containing protein 2 [Paraphysoderma sedebokerense]
MDMIKMDEKFFHKLCFKCSHCNTLLGIGKFSHYQGKYYCKPHFSQLFKSKGNYDEGFGHQQHKDQWKNKSETSGASA